MHKPVYRICYCQILYPGLLDALGSTKLPLPQETSQSFVKDSGPVDHWLKYRYVLLICPDCLEGGVIAFIYEEESTGEIACTQCGHVLD